MAGSGVGCGNVVAIAVLAWELMQAANVRANVVTPMTEASG
jgi:hypothetical protein